MFNGSDVVTVLFGIEGMRVRAQAEIVGEWWLRIETTTDLLGCPACGTRAVGHGRRQVRVRDLPVFGRPVVLIWAKRIWRCPDPECAVKTDSVAPTRSASSRWLKPRVSRRAHIFIGSRIARPAFSYPPRRCGLYARAALTLSQLCRPVIGSSRVSPSEMHRCIAFSAGRSPVAPGAA